MTARTTNMIMRFASPFDLPGLDAPQPAGDYSVDIDEEEISGATWSAWTRSAVFIHLPAVEARSMTHQMISLSPEQLDAILAKGKAKATEIPANSIEA